MRILLCTEFYHTRGGGYAFALRTQELLEARGREVIPLAARHPDNLPSPHEADFIGYQDVHAVKGLAKAAALARLIANPEAAAAVRRLIRRWRPDLVHTHIIATYLTQSVWSAAAAAGLPVVHTLHDYKLLCPDTSLWRAGAVCEQCRGGRYYQCLVRRCKAGSFAASAAAAAQAYANAFLRRARRCVDAFVAPSLFLARKHVEWGLPRSRIACIPNFVDLSRPPRKRPGRYFLFLGRLSKEKGVEVLLEAARRLPYHQFTVAGDGPLREAFEAAAPPNVCFLGLQTRAQADELLAHCRALVVPSTWYENASLSVLEAMAAGAPVIASRIGGLPEQVGDGVEGFLVEPGDAEALASAVERMDEATAARLGAAARRKAERAYSPDAHYERLMSLYRRVLTRRSPRAV